MLWDQTLEGEVEGVGALAAHLFHQPGAFRRELDPGGAPVAEVAGAADETVIGQLADAALEHRGVDALRLRQRAQSDGAAARQVQEDGDASRREAGPGCRVGRAEAAVETREGNSQARGGVGVKGDWCQ